MIFTLGRALTTRVPGAGEAPEVIIKAIVLLAAGSSNGKELKKRDISLVPLST